MIDELWAHWQKHERKKLPIVKFVKARPKDLNALQVGWVERAPHAGNLKRKAYVEVDDDSDNSNNEPGPLLLANKGKVANHLGGNASICGPSEATFKATSAFRAA